MGCLTELTAQNILEKQNMFKYWNYRDMLTRKFLNVPDRSPQEYDQLGTSYEVNERYLRGKSLPNTEYQYFDWCKIEYVHNESRLEGTTWQLDQYDPQCPNEYMLKADDAAAQLGWYIGVLATEWYILHQRGLSTEKTEKELYWAIRASIRLDEYAEAYMKEFAYGFSVNDDIYVGKFANFNLRNGLFMRNDNYGWMVPNYGFKTDQVIDHRSGDRTKVYLSSYNESWRNVFDIIEGSRAKYLTDKRFEWEGKTNLMSQDMIVYLFIGFSLVHKLVPDWVQPYGISVKQMVKEQTIKIMDYLEAHEYTIRIPNSSDHAELGWFIVPYREPLSIIGQKITGEPYHDREVIRQNGPNPFAHWGKKTWQLLQLSKTARTIMGNDDNLGMTLALAAMSNSWHLPVFNNNTTRLSMSRLILDKFNECKHCKKYVYSYLHRVLRDDRTLHDLEQVTRLGLKLALSDAPCEGPAFKFRTQPTMVDLLNTDHPLYSTNHLRTAKSGWRENNRWIHTDGAYRDSEDNEGHKGLFNGLDYMLAYNLSLIDDNLFLFPPPWFENQLNYHLTNVSFPTQNGEGSTQNPKKVIGINSVNIDNVQFNNDSEVEVYSTGSIKLNGQLVSTQNSTVHLKIVNDVTNVRDVCTDIYPNLLVVPDSNQHEPDLDSLLAASIYPLTEADIDQMVQYFMDSVVCLTEAELDTLISGNASNRIFAKMDSCRQLYDSTYVPENFGNRKDLETFIQPARPITINVYPNPFQSGFDIRFTLPEQERVTITVLNGLGVPVLEVVQEQSYPAGTHEVTVASSTLTAGMYCCKVVVGNKTVQTFNLIKTQ